MANKRIGLREIRALAPSQTIWDAAVPGFGARRQRGEAIAYVLKFRTAEGRQRWHTIGRHGAPWTPETAREEARRRGILETVAAADGIVRAAARAGMPAPLSARTVFEAAASGDERASAVVAREARLVASAICCVITVLDPALIVLGGGVGQAPGFAEAVTTELSALAPVLPEVRVSALGTDVVVDGCLAEGTSLAWGQLTSGAS